MKPLQLLSALALLALPTLGLAGVGAQSQTVVSYLHGAPAGTPLFSSNFTGATTVSTIASTTSQGFEDAYARASLQDGSLKARSGGTANRVNAGANALMGDTFGALDAATGLPYAWQASDTVTFSFAVTGAMLQSLSSAQMAALDANFTSLTFFSLGAWRPGFFIRQERIAELRLLPYTPAVAAEWTLLQNEINALSITSNVTWLGRPYSPNFDGSSVPHVNVDPLTPTQVQLSFNPQGSFEWVAQLNVSTMFQPAQALAQRPTFIADFSNSAVASFSGPAGTVTTSSLGYFPGTVAVVPEPQAAALMLLGLATLLWQRRRARVAASGLP